MTIRMGAREARNNFSDLLSRVHYGGETVIIERNGKPMVAMVPMDSYERERAERFRRFETLRESIPQYPIEEVEQDISEAIHAVRAEMQTEQT